MEAYDTVFAFDSINKDEDWRNLFDYVNMNNT
jgi:hypothetical protein